MFSQGLEDECQLATWEIWQAAGRIKSKCRVSGPETEQQEEGICRWSQARRISQSRLSCPAADTFVSMLLLALSFLSIHSYYAHSGQGLPLVFECTISFNDHSRLSDET